MSMHHIEWTGSEWHDAPEAASASFEGYTADIYPTEDGSWFWRVDATSAVSEYPEVQSAGTAPNASEARSAANAGLLRAAT